MAILKVCTALSASPFVAGWYGADVRYRIPFRLVNSLNSLLVKHVPLSDTIISGRPCVAKILRSILRSFSMVYDVAVDGITSTSIYLGVCIHQD